MAKKPSKPEAEEGAEGVEQPKAGKKKLIIMIAAALLVVGGGGGAGWFFFLKKKPAAEAAAHAAPVVKPVAFLDVPELTVNLSGGDRPHFLKLRVALELPDATMGAGITPLMPRVLDTFQVYLREMRPSDLDGSAGMFRLKEELTRRVNIVVAPSKVNAVLFKEVVVQ